ncbi:hypothetical protein ACI2JA_03810 [Alkalihalobacillus sp. NPDC078783]
MEYELKYVAKEYPHGWSLWIVRDDKKFMIGSAIKTELEMNNLISNIKLESKERMSREEKLLDEIKKLKIYKQSYEELMRKLESRNAETQ